MGVYAVVIVGHFVLITFVINTQQRLETFIRIDLKFKMAV